MRHQPRRLSGHTPRPKHCVIHRREPPRTCSGPSSISNKHRIGSQVARLLSSQTVGSHELALAVVCFFGGYPVGYPPHFSQPNMEAPAYRRSNHIWFERYPNRFFALGLMALAVAWTASLTPWLISCQWRSLDFQRGTDSYSEALSGICLVELFPFRFFFPNTRTPLA